MSIVIIVFYFILLCFVIKQLPFFKESGLKIQFLWVVLLLKFLVSICLFFIYTYYYPDRITADIFKYFDDSEIIYKSFFDSYSDFKNLIFEINLDTNHYTDNYLKYMNNWDRSFSTGVYNDNRTLIKINALFRFISFSEFHVHSLFFCFLSLTGMVAIFRVVKNLFSQSKSVLVIFIFFMPSVLLWSSGILKESIHLFALGMFIFSLDNILTFKRLSGSIIILLISLLLMLYIKVFVLIALTPSITCYIIASYTKVKKWKVYLPILFLFTVFVLFSNHMFSNLNLLEILKNKQENFIRFSEFYDAGSRFHLTKIDDSIIGFLKVIPEGLLNCFIRPLPWETKSLIEAPVIIENLLIITGLLILLKLVLKREIKTSKNHINFIFFSLVFVCFLYIIIGITTPVAGSLVRYKISGLPFLSIVLIYFFQNFNLFTSLDLKLNKLIFQ